MYRYVQAQYHVIYRHELYTSQLVSPKQLFPKRNHETQAKLPYAQLNFLSRSNARKRVNRPGNQALFGCLERK